jgi:hypothetical protein
MFLLVLLGSVALQAWAWRNLRRRIQAGSLTKLAAVLRYSAWALAPLVAFAALFLGVIALEEVTGSAVLPEPLARATLPAAAVLLCLAGLGTLAFGIVGAVGTPRGHAKA